MDGCTSDLLWQSLTFSNFESAVVTGSTVATGYVVPQMTQRSWEMCESPWNAVLSLLIAHQSTFHEIADHQWTIIRWNAQHRVEQLEQTSTYSLRKPYPAI